ncbi:hypothetical protein Sipo8835_00785 [Streptomyces ipomoeae]|jgi:hypothetical protein|uniref:Uncharacterized protein n=1 Tax=Streptomyces ipomoeae TaxID=103232 RepID=A0AAE9B3Q3_9ACTN|nr:hypothetical protein [Streptomyces ipomoeae]MDX2697059.1 hypothetical protein [Streptomyces ipomoeae]MDX2824560.1 hypothetical protein [Streptomyces ipomoeae]MDX2840191.1 hypothetical protein [Streptomyces ipomoeae]MDX2873567.1 hypothetical protein [Streptomyces ipomoeae]TQE33600.1 hypothetical protein Sipo7851_20190 [Streptomyces ipomoeae]
MTEKLLSPLRTRSWPERWLTRLAGAALSAAVYVLCLPRDRSLGLGFWESIEDVVPFTVSGLVVLAVALLPLAAYFGYRDTLAWLLLVVAVPPSVVIRVLLLPAHSDFESPAGQFWPHLWGVCTLVIAVWVLLVAAVARRFRKLPSEPPVEEGWVLRAHEPHQP